MLPAWLQTPAALLLVVSGLVSCFAGYRVFRVVLGSWGVPDRSADQLVAELEAHGFVDVEAGRGPFGNWRVRGRLP